MNLQYEDLVRSVYSVLLDREPEPAGLKHWSSALCNGLQKDEFLRSILASAEFREKSGFSESLAKYRDVDLVLPIQGHQFRVPAADTSLVPHLLEHRSWEPHLTRYLSATLKADDVFMDVGANLGYFTIMFSAFVKRIIAFEPVAMTHKYCEANIALNGLANVELYQCGLWKEDTLTSIKMDPSSLMGASITPSGDTGSVESIRCRQLDAMVESDELTLTRLDVIKMDIEGAEVAALQGMRRTLERFKPTILMELNRPALENLGSSIDDVWKFFSNANYDIAAFKHWEEQEPVPVENPDALKALCPPDSLLDILAIARSSAT
jgi:FkbM family methyltransferase